MQNPHRAKAAPPPSRARMNDRERRFLFRTGGTFHLYLDNDYSGYSQPHSHDFYQLLLLNSGHISFMQGGTKYRQTPDDLFFTPPKCEHSLFFFGGGISYYCLSYTQEIAKPLLAQYPELSPDFSNFPPMLRADARAAAFIRASFDAALLEGDILNGMAGEPSEYLAAAALSRAFALARAHVSANAKGESAPDADAAVHAAVRYIDRHFFEDISVDGVAKSAGLSKSFFCRKFQEIAGVPPKRYITEKRMHEALKLIHGGELPLGRIAEDVGYQDFSTFYRSFHKMTGVSPSAYKASLLGDSDPNDRRRFQP